jgi:hypothetical protein
MEVNLQMPLWVRMKSCAAVGPFSIGFLPFCE